MGERRNQSPIGKESLLAQALDRTNLMRALKQVTRNKGAAGVDGMTVEDLPDHLTHHWPEIKSQLLSGHYRPQAVKRVEIPKPDGRKRKLGIPTSTGSSTLIWMHSLIVLTMTG
jgi:retron-type reverse transcriptase